jgi:hypothetical protein
LPGLHPDPRGAYGPARITYLTLGENADENVVSPEDHSESGVLVVAFGPEAGIVGAMRVLKGVRGS